MTVLAEVTRVSRIFWLYVGGVFTPTALTLVGLLLYGACVVLRDFAKGIGEWAVVIWVMLGDYLLALAWLVGLFTIFGSSSVNSQFAAADWVQAVITLLLWVWYIVWLRRKRLPFLQRCEKYSTLGFIPIPWNKSSISAEGA